MIFFKTNWIWFENRHWIECSSTVSSCRMGVVRSSGGGRKSSITQTHLFPSLPTNAPWTMHLFTNYISLPPPSRSFEKKTLQEWKTALTSRYKNLLLVFLCIFLLLLYFCLDIALIKCLRGKSLGIKRTKKKLKINCLKTLLCYQSELYCESTLHFFAAQPLVQGTKGRGLEEGGGWIGWDCPPS